MTSRNDVLRARVLRSAATPPERLLWTFLRTLRGDGRHFRRQAPFWGYVLDFVSYQDRLVIEVDGAAHGDAVRAACDAQRDAVLAQEGFRTLRVLAGDVMGNLEGVAWLVRRSLDSAASPPGCPPPRPSPQGGGGRTAF